MHLFPPKGIPSKKGTSSPGSIFNPRRVWRKIRANSFWNHPVHTPLFLLCRNHSLAKRNLFCHTCSRALGGLIGSGHQGSPISDSCSPVPWCRLQKKFPASPILRFTKAKRQQQQQEKDAANINLCPRGKTKTKLERKYFSGLAVRNFSEADFFLDRIL